MHEASVPGAAIEGQFDSRIEAVRRRFAVTFADRMQQTIVALPQMIGAVTASGEPVENADRWLDKICGIVSTIRFRSTGQSALACNALLIGLYRAKPELSEAVLAQLSERLELLRLAAQAEMHILESNQG